MGDPGLGGADFQSIHPYNKGDENDDPVEEPAQAMGRRIWAEHKGERHNRIPLYEQAEEGFPSIPA
jgi:hypothetical protein